MGIVASLATVPVTVEVVKDEKRREREHREDVKYGRYKVGDGDLALIKRMSIAEGNGHKTPAEGNIEKIYLTGVNKEKYRYISKKIDQEMMTPGRKVRSAYPTVRFS